MRYFMQKNPINFTPLKFKNLNPKKFLIDETKLFYLSTTLFLFGLALFFINVFIPNLLILTSQRSRADQKKTEKIIINHPQKFQKISQVDFVPKKINDIEIDVEKITNFYREIYPNLSNSELIKIINNRLFTYLAINEEKAKSQLNQFQGDQFEQELEREIKNYRDNEIKVDFYFFKVRFEGTTKANQSKLGLTNSSLKELAQKKINEYHQMELDPIEIAKKMNEDQIILLLNNNENPSELIEGYTHATPLFDDPDFYSFLIEAPISQKTPIVSLKTKNPHESSPKDYLFIFFYPVSKIGQLPNLQFVVDKYLAESELQQ